MSYLVLARKWRPHTFSELVGQQHVAETLEKAIESSRIAHAFLFTGTRGVGKTSTARILAMALNCEKGPTPKPCGKCSSCREVKGGIGLDVMEIDGASNRGIDDVRELREQIAYTPAKGKYRIVIIDEVHMLTKEAFNALLKSLEEPPPNFIFIFATTEPHKVPETILSRVQRYDFRRISHADILKRLQFICDAEKIACEAEGLSFIVRKADGSMRDALTLLRYYPYGFQNICRRVRSDRICGRIGRTCP
jgi:DNA polymerase-3 subunit gamma/tau